MVYVITTEDYCGITCYLQMRNVISNIFYNNNIKIYKSKYTAIRNAKKQLAIRQSISKIHVLGIDEDKEFTTSELKNLYGTDKDIWYSLCVCHTDYELQLCIYQTKLGYEGELVDGRNKTILHYNSNTINDVKEHFNFFKNN